jgi:hypothetical protein
MADIKINGYNETSSRNDGQQWTIHFVLSEQPNEAWRSDFDSIKSKNKNTEVAISSTSIKGKELVVTSPARLKAQEILDEMKRIVELTNQAQGGYKKQLQELKFD